MFAARCCPFVAAALVVGGIASILDADGLAVAVWSVASGVVVIDLVVVTVVRLREGRVAVDVVALVALVGALLLGEALAGVILALMVASGDALEQYAHRRAERSLSELLSLAPKVAHRLVAGRFETVPVDEVVPGEVLLVKPGEVVPVDGSVLEPAVLDESVLTGEAQSVQRERRGMGAQRIAERGRGIPDAGFGVGGRELLCGDRPAREVRGRRKGSVRPSRGSVRRGLRAGGVRDRWWCMAGDGGFGADARRVGGCDAVSARVGGPGGGGVGDCLRRAQRGGGQGRRGVGGDGADTHGAVGQDRHADGGAGSRRRGRDCAGPRRSGGDGVGGVGGAGVTACAGRDGGARGASIEA